MAEPGAAVRLTLLTQLPEDCLHELIARVAVATGSGHAAVDALLDLKAVSRGLRALVLAADAVWASVSHALYGYMSASLSQVCMFESDEKQIVYTLEWIQPILARGARAAYACPTVLRPGTPGDAAMDLLSGGSWAGALEPPTGLADFRRLTTVSSSISRLVLALVSWGESRTPRDPSATRRPLRARGPRVGPPPPPPPPTPIFPRPRPPPPPPPPTRVGRRRTLRLCRSASTPSSSRPMS